MKVTVQSKEERRREEGREGENERERGREGREVALLQREPCFSCAN